MEHIIFKKEQYSLKSISANPVSGFSPKKMLYIIYITKAMLYITTPKNYISVHWQNIKYTIIIDYWKKYAVLNFHVLILKGIVNTRLADSLNYDSQMKWSPGRREEQRKPDPLTQCRPLPALAGACRRAHSEPPTGSFCHFHTQ